MANQQTLINGNRYSFVDIDIVVNGVPIQKGAISAIAYSWNQEPGLVQGNQVAPVGRTAGYGTAKGSITLLIYEDDQLMSNLAQSTPQGTMGNVDFTMVISYNINDVDTRTDTLIGCRITSGDISQSKGSEATYVTHELSIMQLKQNGIAAFSIGDLNSGS